jgi:hypothetical protein
MFNGFQYRLIKNLRTHVKKLIVMLLLLGSMHALAGTMGEKKSLPWHFNATLGYVNYSDMVDANVAIQRIAGARDLFAYRNTTLGIEIGVQTGLSSRLWASQAELDVLGTSATEMVINPFFDVLGTVSVPLDLSSVIVIDDLSIFSKIGMAYRQMHFDNNMIHRKVQISPEVQAGLTQSLSPHASISIAYQGIYAGKSRLTINRTNPSAITGAVSSIPSQNGGLVIFAWNAG